MSNTLKPSVLPSSFKPSPVAWVPVEMPAPQRGGHYVAGFMVQQEAGAKGLRPKPPVPSRKKKPVVEAKPDETLIWVCDSDDKFTEVVTDCLRHWGFRFEVFAEGSAALEALSRGEAPHVLVEGFQPGGMKGVELAQEFARKVSDIEVVLAAAPTEVLFALEAKSARIHELVVKPLIRTEDFRAAVANACRRVHETLYARFLVAEFDRYHRSMEIEARLSAELSEFVDLGKTLEVSCKALSELFDDGGALFFQFQPSQRSLTAAARYPQGIFAGAVPKLMIPPEIPVDMNAVKSWLSGLGDKEEFRAMMSQASEMSPDLLTGFEAVTWKTALVETRGIPRGVVAVLTHRWNEKTDPVRLQRIAQNLSKSFEIALLHARIAETTTEDSFTGLANDKFLARRLQEEIGKASRLKHPLTVLTFSKVEANADHKSSKKTRTQDRHLKHLAQLVKANFRSTDVMAFRGGEQFAVVLPHTSFVDALRKAERFRDAVRDKAASEWSLATGVAEYPGHAAGAEELLFAAEDACASASQTEPFGIHIATVREGYVPPFLPESPRSTFLKSRRNTDASR